MEASLSAATRLEGLGALVHLDAEMARAGAVAADAMPKGQRGAFHGVPFLVKDLGGTARGLPQSAGSAAIRQRQAPPTEDSDLMAGFRSMGLIPFGVTATPPFGLSLTCEPEGMVPARNPWNPHITPGGSSGGAAASVAAGIVAIAHATDAAGSIRIPAACCGLVGLKPSRGAVPGGPDFLNDLMGIASELVLARTVRDVEAAFLGVRRAQVPVVLPANPRIALALPERCDRAQIDAAQEAAYALRDAGCALHEMAAPDRLGAAAHDIARQVFCASLGEFLGAMAVPEEKLPPLAAAMAEAGSASPATQLFATARQIARISHQVEALFAARDAIVMPVLSDRPLPVGAIDLQGTDPVGHMAKMEAFAPNAALANVAGLPALALPFGMTDGLPVAVQLIGPVGGDLGLLRLAAMIEARAPALAFPHPIAGLAA